MQNNYRLVKQAVLIVMVFSSCLWAENKSVIVNGSFENDGRIISDITVIDTPHRWTDVNIPAEPFGAWVKNDWSTYVDNGYSLTIYSRGIEAPGTPVITAGDIATVSQEVYFGDANEVFFDLKLDEAYVGVWDATKRTAVILIDGNVVWDSGELGAGADGEYRDLSFDVNDVYKDANTHILSLGIRSEVSEVGPFLQFWTQWDVIRFDAYCEGFGYRPMDFDQNCYVDWYDLRLFLEHGWLVVPSEPKYDLHVDNFIDAFDFTIFLQNWMDHSFGYEQPLAQDLNNDGIINFIDFSMATQDWSEGDYESILELRDNWLEVNWLWWWWL